MNRISGQERSLKMSSTNHSTDYRLFLVFFALLARFVPLKLCVFSERVLTFVQSVRNTNTTSEFNFAHMYDKFLGCSSQTLLKELGEVGYQYEEQCHTIWSPGHKGYKCVTCGHGLVSILRPPSLLSH